MGIFDFFRNGEERKPEQAKPKSIEGLPDEKEKDTSGELTPPSAKKDYKPKDRPPARSHEYYEVQKGDSLSKIAKDYYGDASKWKLIYQANKEGIKNPDMIYPGQVIELPDLHEQGN